MTTQTNGQLTSVGNLPDEIEHLRKQIAEETSSDIVPLSSFNWRLMFNVTPLMQDYFKVARNGPKGTVDDVEQELQLMFNHALGVAKAAA